MYVWIVRFIHLLVVAFFLLAPFSSDQRILSIHFVAVPFLILHWITNQSVCALTEMEKFLTGKTDDMETFIGGIVAPVYKFQSRGQEDMFIWSTLILLWLFTLYKLKQDNFSHFREVFTSLRQGIQHLR